MTDVIERLLAVQECDKQAKDLKHQLARVPLEKKLRQDQLAAAEARLETAKTRMKQIEVEKKALEVEIDSKQQHIRRYQTQQLETRKNEEYTALGHEIDAARQTITQLEDQELVLMEEAEALTPEIQSAERTCEEEKQKIQKALSALDASVPNLQKRLADAEAERSRLADGIDAPLLDLYTRLFANKGGSAIVALEHDVCTGCHMKVTNQTSVEVRGGRGVVHCPNCGRILY